MNIDHDDPYVTLLVEDDQDAEVLTSVFDPDDPDVEMGLRFVELNVEGRPELYRLAQLCLK